MCGCDEHTVCIAIVEHVRTYIRESRRLRALFTVREQHVAAALGRVAGPGVHLGEGPEEVDRRGPRRGEDGAGGGSGGPGGSSPATAPTGAAGVSAAVAPGG